MLDIHTHILPEMDDGSTSVNESIEMLLELKRQGVNTVALTSHFYADSESPESFLARRSRSYRILREEIVNRELEEAVPEMVLGAEVTYYAGISQTEQLPLLCIEGTDLLLLEMPMNTWNHTVLEEVDTMAATSHFQLVLAHIDRYLEFNKLDVYQDLARSGILMQVNARFIMDKGNKRMLRKLFANNLMQFIGSDCHGIKYRSPKIADAAQMMDKVLKDSWHRVLYHYEKKYF